jgi:hypothetical protein
MYYKNIPMKTARSLSLLIAAGVLLAAISSLTFAPSSSSANAQTPSTTQRTDCSNGTCMTTTCINGACSTTTSGKSGNSGSNYVLNICSDGSCYVKTCTNGVCTTTRTPSTLATSASSSSSTSLSNSNVNNMQQQSSNILTPSPVIAQSSPTQSTCIQKANTHFNSAISAYTQQITQGSLTNNQATIKAATTALNDAISAYNTAITGCAIPN